MKHFRLTLALRVTGYSENEAEISANKTVEIEQMLAQWQTDEPYVPLTDSYEHYDLAALQGHSPNIPWTKYFGGEGSCRKSRGNFAWLLRSPKTVYGPGVPVYLVCKYCQPHPQLQCDALPC
jgi:hypothetical protein